MARSWLIPRRTVLKGMRVATIALPLLEAMGWADPPKKAPVPLAHPGGVLL
jgi:hypothetical protein